METSILPGYVFGCTSLLPTKSICTESEQGYKKSLDGEMILTGRAFSLFHARCLKYAFFSVHHGVK